MGSSPPNTTEKEYGKRLYVSDLTYQGQIGKPTDKAFDDMYKLPHSENKKPYMEDSYEEMEYFQSPPFGFPWNFPDFDAPWQVPGEPIGLPWLLIFWCGLDIESCYCPEEKRCYDLNCWHDIVKVSVNEFLTLEPHKFSVTVSSGQLCVTAAADAETDSVYIDILMVADPGDGSIIYGEYQGLSVAPCCKEDCGCTGAETPVAYDRTSSPATINRIDTEIIYVTPGTAPYTWVITGTGLTLGSAVTAGVSNTVTADGSACGCGAITVTDACGNIAYGGIRVVEASAWSVYGDMEEVTWEPCNQTWGDTQAGEVCDHDCYQHKQVKAGGWHTGCPGCRCSNYLLEHSNSLAGCRYNCTWQPGARSLKYCRISIRLYGCS